MFSVAMQTVQIRSLADARTIHDGDAVDTPPVTMRFMPNDSDTSKCLLEIDTPDGETHRLLFIRGGQLVDYTVREANDSAVAEAVDDAPKTIDDVPAEHRGMRDASAFDAMTYKAPIPPEALQRGESMSLSPVRNTVAPVTERNRPRPNEGRPEDNPNSQAAQDAYRAQDAYLDGARQVPGPGNVNSTASLAGLPAGQQAPYDPNAVRNGNAPAPRPA